MTIHLPTLHGMEPEKPLVLCGLRNVIQYVTFPGGFYSVANTTPDSIEKALFSYANQVDLEPQWHSDLAGPYPPLIKAWLAGRLTGETVSEKIKKYIPFWYLIHHTAAQTAFTPQKAAQAFTTDKPTVEILERCKSKAILALCTNMHLEHFVHLAQQDTELYSSLFEREQRYLSGKCGILTTDHRFYEQFLTTQHRAPESCFFIDAEEQTCQAAHEAGLLKENILQYSCKEKSAQDKLNYFLTKHNLLPAKQ